jgi:hypothetical protein
MHKYERDYLYFKDKYESFMNQVKDCPERQKYEWNPNDVCLNAKNCFKLNIWYQKKAEECKCIGKLNYKCNSDYCAADKRACNKIMKRKKNNIKKC